MRFKSLLPFNPYRSVTTHRGDLYEGMWAELDQILNRRPFSDWGLGTVKVDVYEDKTGVIVRADLPGVDEEDIDLTLYDSTLTIRGEKKTEKEAKEENFYVMERTAGSFTRSISLPYKADVNKVDAEYRQGVLTIKIPRPQTLESQIKKIKVKSQTQTKTTKK